MVLLQNLSMWVSVAILTTFFTLATCELEKYPEFIRECPRNNSQQCVFQIVKDIQRQLGKGIPELGVPSVEPFLIPQLVADRDSGPVAVKATLRNLLVKGLSNITVTSVRLDLDKLRLELRARIPQLRATGNYDVQGKVLLLPIHGKGDFWVIAYNVDAVVYGDARLVQRNGRNYVNIEHLKLNWQIRNVRLRLNNLFNGDRLLGDTLNVFINENWRELVDEVRPSLSVAFEKLLRQTLAGPFSKVPIDLIFKDLAPSP